MADIKIKKLTNCNVYVDGASFCGRAEEFDVPEIIFKMTEHKALGLQGSFELPTGIDKMEARVKWSSFDPDAFSASANPFVAKQIMIRGNLETHESSGRTAEQSVKIVMTAQSKNIPGFKFKPQDNVEMESKFTVTYCKLTVAGVDHYEVDVLANIMKIDGVDVLANFRQNT